MSLNEITGVCCEIIKIIDSSGAGWWYFAKILAAALIQPNQAKITSAPAHHQLISLCYCVRTHAYIVEQHSLRLSHFSTFHGQMIYHLIIFPFWTLSLLFDWFYADQIYRHFTLDLFHRMKVIIFVLLMLIHRYTRHRTHIKWKCMIKWWYDHLIWLRLLSIDFYIVFGLFKIKLLHISRAWIEIIKTAPNLLSRLSFFLR